MHLTLDLGLLTAARAALGFRMQAFIDGKYAPSAGGKTYTSVNPADGKPLAEIADCGPEDVAAAVRAARRAFQSGCWSKQEPGDRKHATLKFVELLEKNALELALLDCLDAGNPTRSITTSRGWRIGGSRCRRQWRRRLPWRWAHAMSPSSWCGKP